MPLTHSRTFRIRYYECDAYGHVNAISYIRYMEEAAFDASAALGYDLARYRAIQKIWFVLETDIEYLAPMRYGGSVTVATWVEDMRKVRSRRAYEIRDEGTGQVVARASSDWAFLDTSTGRPAAIPGEIAAIFMPDGQPAETAHHDKFPAPLPAPSSIFRQRRRVEWRDLDPDQHVNNAVYLAYVEECAIQAANAYGWTDARMRDDGFGIFTRRHQIEYKGQAVLDDELDIATWFSGVRNTSCTRHYAITRVSDGAPIAQAHSVYVWVNLATGKPTPIPEGLLTDFAPNRSQP
jgi:acyl-CoA thioester hydrolase